MKRGGPSHQDESTTAANSSAPVNGRALRHRFANLEQRLRLLERFVTSEHFDLQRELAKMEAVGDQQATPTATGPR